MSQATFAPALQYLVALRTRLIDEELAGWLLRRSQDDACPQQVVQLAVGCDTRALRLQTLGFTEDAPWSLERSRQVCFFEVDSPRVVQFRQQMMEEFGIPTHRTRAAPLVCEQVSFDLRTPEELVTKLISEHGFDPEAPTAWICEGLLEYHPQDFAERLLRVVGSAKPPKSSCQQGDALILAILDAYWHDFLQEQYSQRPVRLAWQKDLPSLEVTVDLLRACGFPSLSVISELQLPDHGALQQTVASPATPHLKGGSGGGRGRTLHRSSLFHVLHASLRRA